MTFKGFIAGGSISEGFSSVGTVVGFTKGDHVEAEQLGGLELRSATPVERNQEKRPQQYQKHDRVPLSEIFNCRSLKGEKITNDKETVDLKIPKELLKRIDPSL